MKTKNTFRIIYRHSAAVMYTRVWPRSNHQTERTEQTGETENYRDLRNMYGARA